MHICFYRRSGRRDSNPQGVTEGNNLRPSRLGNQIKKTSLKTRDVIFVGAVDGTRTRDPRLGKPMLYQLSHYRKRNVIASDSSLHKATTHLLLLDDQVGHHIDHALNLLGATTAELVRSIYFIQIREHSKDIRNIAVEIQLRVAINDTLEGA